MRQQIISFNMGERIGRTSWTFFLLVTMNSILLLNILILPSLGRRIMNGKIISGIYSEQLPLPHFYESYIPVIFEYKTPKWNKTEVTFNNWYNCTGERIPYVLSCPISFHLNSAIENLHTDFESLQPGKDEEGHLNKDHFDTLTSQSDFCHQIQNHFTSIYTHTVDFDKYLEMLEKCSRAKLQQGHSTASQSAVTTTESSDSVLFHIERNMTDYIYSVRARYSRMETNFYDTFYRPLSAAAMASTSPNDTNTLKLVAASVLSNSRTALQGSLLGHFYGERNRWTHAISSCQSHTLPSSLVNETKLKSVLTQITKSRYADLGFRLTIPSQFVSKYFTLPLTDCTHTSDVFVVRLLVPVVKNFGNVTTNSFSLRRVRNVPFLVKSRNAICQLRNILDEATYLFDPVSLTAYTTECRSNEPCDISSSRLSGKIDLCASMIFAHRIDLMIQYCDLTCQDHIRPPFPGIMVQQIATNKFALAGQDLVKLVCRLNEADTETLDIDLNEKDYGGYELVLNCDCQLFINGGKSLVIQSGMLVPCDQVEPYYQIFQTVPWHFVRSEKSQEIRDLFMGKFHVRNSTNNNNNNDHTIEEQPMQVELFNENHLDNLLDLDYIDDLVTRSQVRDNFWAAAAAPPQQKRGEKRDDGEESGSNFNWLFIPLVMVVIVLCAGQIFLVYQVNKIRGNPYFSLHNSVLYKSTTTPSLVAQEND